MTSILITEEGHYTGKLYFCYMFIAWLAISTVAAFGYGLYLYLVNLCVWDPTLSVKISDRQEVLSDPSKWKPVNIGVQTDVKVTQKVF